VGRPPLTFAARSAEFLQGLLSITNAVDPQVRLDTVIANAREIARLLGLPDQTPTQPTGGPGTAAVDALLQDEVGKQVQSAVQRIEDGVTQQIQTAVQAAIGPLQQTIASLQDQLAARPAAKKPPSRGGGTGGPNG
jgi:hypothetical protein